MPERDYRWERVARRFAALILCLCVSALWAVPLAGQLLPQSMSCCKRGKVHACCKRKAAQHGPQIESKQPCGERCQSQASGLGAATPAPPAHIILERKLRAESIPAPLAGLQTSVLPLELYQRPPPQA